MTPPRSGSGPVPHLAPGDRVILFDGVCKLCNAWSQFILQHDRRHVFRLCSVQSPAGQAILAHFGYPTDTFETMLVVDGERSLAQSDAFFFVMRQLGWPWRGLCVAQVLPRWLRDGLYDRIARNRYRLFGQHAHCMLPAPEHAWRFVQAR